MFAQDHPDAPAFPSNAWLIEGGTGHSDDHDLGISVRLYIATRCLAGLLAADPDGRTETLVRRALNATDELLRQVWTDGRPSQAVPDRTSDTPEPLTPSDYDGIDD